MNACYKCGSTEHTSVKKTDRRGNKVYMCTPCRYKQSGRLPAKDRKRGAEFKFDADIDYDWNRRARESHERILARFG